MDKTEEPENTGGSIAWRFSLSNGHSSWIIQYNYDGGRERPKYVKQVVSEGRRWGLLKMVVSKSGRPSDFVGIVESASRRSVKERVREKCLL